MNVADIVKLLGYTAQWLEWGVVDEAYLRAQHSKYAGSDDKNQEHYRCAAFRDFLDRNTQLADDLVENILRLQDEGPDGCDLSANRAIELILSGILSDEQHFSLATRHPLVLQPPIERQYNRESLWRKIRQSGLVVNFAEIQACRDPAIQLSLFERSDLSREHLQWLQNAGSNKGIRNRAAAMLRSKRFREP